MMMSLASSLLTNQSMNLAHSSLTSLVSATEKNIPGLYHRAAWPASLTGGTSSSRVSLPALAPMLAKLSQDWWKAASPVMTGLASLPRVAICSYSSGLGAAPASIRSFHSWK